MNIVFITDDAYTQHAGVMLESLFQTNKGIYANIYCLSFSLCQENKDKLRVVCQDRAKLTFIEGKDQQDFLKSLAVGGNVKQWNPIMYLKCFMHLLLPNDVQRLLFLDVDMVINHDLKPLFEMELYGKVVAGADDWKYSYLHKERIGLSTMDEYINSGVLLVDVEKWRNMAQKCSMDAFLKKNKTDIINDQDVFALYFKGKILLIEQKWNVTTYWFERKPRIMDKYLPQLVEVRCNPYIIHFCEPIKPWFKECRHPYVKLYKRYLKETPWKAYKFPSCGLHFGKPAWRYVVKQWLNDIGIRHDDWAMIKM